MWHVQLQALLELDSPHLHLAKAFIQVMLVALGITLHLLPMGDNFECLNFPN